MIVDQGLKQELLSVTTGKELPDEATVERWLKFDGLNLKTLYHTADEVRKEYVGDEIFVRGIIEFSNYCRRNCNYCGIRAGNREVKRYRMTEQEIANLAHQGVHYGCTTVVLQSGEDPHFSAADLCSIIEQIKIFPNLAVTLSVGEWSYQDYVAFRNAGADRYLLRFETSDPELFAELHPDDDLEQRLLCLKMIRRAGMQLGSGFMIGLPHTGLGILVRDILFATRMKLDMIGVGPFLAHPQTPLACKPRLKDIEIYFKVISILRLLNPYAHLPATTAFDALTKLGRDKCLQVGANVFMPNITPQRYRVLYQLYPNKPCVDEDAGQCASCTLARVLRLGRKMGRDVGHSFLPEWRMRQDANSTVS
ncbi:MAG: [FeFe] hydrogenase H-cluster radical SAM maturase HydE [Lentisphaerae bacterium]|nr:MAG: [FeFe] hydrogenase H-cluster radical SAM maturase HydE [Lentisphaerota bacterium]